MNKNELKIEMLRNGETGDDLAKALDISRQTLSNKMSENQSNIFSQKEIKIIIDRYHLTPNRVFEIFFADDLS